MISELGIKVEYIQNFKCIHKTGKFTLMTRE